MESINTNCVSNNRNKTPKLHKNTRNIQLTIMVSLSIVWLGVFAYLPMAGILLAFKDGNKSLNIFNALFNSGWTLDNFKMLFSDDDFWGVFWNTLRINSLLLLINFPMPIIFALLLNEVKNKTVKTSVQTIANFPHFISWVVFGGIVIFLTDSEIGIVNPILELLGLSSQANPVDLNLAEYFYPKIIISSIIKGTGWGSIVYLAAIAGIDPELYEAAELDGANRFQKAIYITLPSIKSTIFVLLLLNISRITSNSFEQFYVFQTTANLARTRVLSTYMYELAFTYRNYSTATALSLFEGLISVVLLSTANFISKKVNGEGIY